MKRLVTFVTLALLLTGLTAGPAVADGKGTGTAGKPGAGADDGRRSFGLQPAGPHGPDARAFYSYSVSPGAVLTDRLAVLNVSDRPARLTVYAADAFNTAAGGFDVAAQGVASTDLGGWLHLRGDGPFQVKVPARSHVVIPFTLRVPRTATPGDHAGGIVASLRTLATSGDGSSVAIDQRVGVRVYTRVSGKLRPHLAVTGLHADFHGAATGAHGYVLASWTIRNDGNVILGGQVLARITGLMTDVRGPRLADVPPLLPGQSHRVTARVADVPRALRLSVTASVVPRSVAGVVDPVLPADSATVHVWAVPWLLIGLTLLVLGIGVGAWRLRRRSRRDGSAGGPAGGRPDADRTVVQLPHPPVVPEPDRQRVSRGLMAAFALLLAAAGGLLAASPASAAEGVTFLPGSGLDITPTYLVTPQPCPDEATNVVAVAQGHGFPGAGQVVVTNSMAPVRHDAPMVIHLQDTFNGFAAVNATKLAGDYKVTVRCVDHLLQHTYASWAGTLTFEDPRHFTAAEPSQQTRDAVVAAETAAQSGGQSAAQPGQGPASGDDPTAPATSGSSESSGGAPASGAAGAPGGAGPAGGGGSGASAGATAGGGSDDKASSRTSGSDPGTGSAADDVAPTAASSSADGIPWLLPVGLAGAALMAGLAILLARRERAGR